MQIEIFTGPGCGYCERAKALLTRRGLDFRERDMSDPAVRAEFAERLPRQKAIPQIFIDGAHIGGFEDLEIRLG
ncbi:glutaredoxin 3 [Maritimibacter sp. 55A14]|uniref:glutaredoxin family protein n=1 Tax=Maritimibacter sp. 55A14 TaxID=2174844 RepID=UPI000D60D1DE|nr:glutaredoxin domain-containing protein [Maritimibacter sp. 55A14]PWE33142.1 glutaredoxin 3 [Maritimibacter sp. 55A14]